MKRLTLSRFVFASCLAFTAALPIAGCEGDAEEFGEDVDEAVEDAGDAVEDAADEVEDGLDHNR